MNDSPQTAVEAENLDVVRRFLDAWVTGDWDAAFSLADSRVQVDNRTEVPDLEGSYVGREEIAGMYRKIFAVWADYRMEPLEFQARGDHVAVLCREGGRARQSGIEGDRRLVQVYTVKEARIVHIEATLHRGGDLREVLDAS